MYNSLRLIFISEIQAFLVTCLRQRKILAHFQVTDAYTKMLSIMLKTIVKEHFKKVKTKLI